METNGIGVNSDQASIDQALLKSLEAWRNDMLADNPPDFCMIDSGDGNHYQPVYEFVRRYGLPFVASKGSNDGRISFEGQDTATRLHFERCRADVQTQEGIWLYHIDSEFWKYQVQNRFLTATFSDQHQFNDGSLSLFASEDKKQHLAFSHHTVAEERQEQFVPGKGLVKKWRKVNPNNHWLDATSLALCAAGVLGLRVVPRQPIAPLASYRPQPTRRITTPDGRAFLASQR
jgi:hypothetical protein